MQVVPTLITTDKLKTFGISKDNSTKSSYCSLQKTQLVAFCSCKNYSISSLLRISLPGI